MAVIQYGMMGVLLLFAITRLLTLRALMGLRPNQTRPRRQQARCQHETSGWTTSPLVPVHVYDTPDGSPEIVAWLCPMCFEEITPRPAPPRGPASVSRPLRRIITDGDNEIVLRSWA